MVDGKITTLLPWAYYAYRHKDGFEAAICPSGKVGTIALVSTMENASLIVKSINDIEKLKEALDHALHNMGRDQQATMSNPTYDEAMELLK